MKTRTHRTVFILTLFFVCTILSIIFRTFLLENFLMPLALLCWLLLRITVLSVDQAVLWNLLILLIAAVAILRFQVFAAENKPQIRMTRNFYRHKLQLWKMYLTHPASRQENKRLKDKLVRLMAELYASRKRTDMNASLLNSFSDGEIPLPPQVYQFLYDHQKKPGKRVPSIRAVYKKLSGREKREYYKNLEEYLLFLENYMEIKDDCESNREYYS